MTRIDKANESLTLLSWRSQRNWTEMILFFTCVLLALYVLVPENGKDIPTFIFLSQKSNRKESGFNT